MNVQVADDMFQDFQDSKEMKKMAVKEIEQLVGRSGSQEMSGGSIVFSMVGRSLYTSLHC